MTWLMEHQNGFWESVDMASTCRILSRTGKGIYCKNIDVTVRRKLKMENDCKDSKKNYKADFEDELSRVDGWKANSS